MRTRSIRTRLLVAFLGLVILPSGLISLIVGQVGQRDLKQQVVRQLRSAVFSRQASLEMWVQDRQRDLGTLLSVPAIRGAVEEALKPPRRRITPNPQLQAQLREYAKANGRIDELFLLNAQGWVVAASDPRFVGEFRGLQNYFMEGRQEAGTHVVTLSYSSVKEGVNALVTVLPLRNTRGETYGVLAGQARLAQLNEIMKTPLGLGRSTETYLVGANHVLLTETLAPTYAPGNTYVTTLAARRAVEERSPGDGIYTNYAGEQVIGVHTWIPSIKAVLVGEQALSEAFLPIHRLMWLSVLVTLAAILVATGASMLLTRSITNPLEHLVHTATRIAEGEVDLTARVERMDEVGQLASAFNTMTQRLRSMLERLNARVSDLQTAETQLTTYTRELEIQIAERIKAEEGRRAMESQMLQTQKMESLGVLAGGIAHDFNNLLTGILGNADLMRETTLAGSEQHQFLERIEAGAQRAAELTKQMLAYSGKGRFEVQMIRLPELIQEMGDLLNASIPKKCSLHFEFAPATPTICADSTQIRQVVMNLIINAAEAIGDHSGTITVRVDTCRPSPSFLRDCIFQADLPEGEYLLLEVSDTGCGMSEETRQRIFEPFFSTKFTGRGLGLAAVLGIVRGHHGAVHIRTAPSQGSTFTILIPIGMEVLGPGSPAVAPESGTRLSGQALVVDDEPVVLEVACRMLRRMGLEVIPAGSGEAALEALQQRAEQITLALLDLTMPGMDGRETLRALRGVRPDLKAILSSGYSLQEEALSPLASEFDGFVQKPYRFEDIRQEVCRVLQGESGQKLR